MQPDPTVSISCDEVLEYEEDAAPFVQGEPEFLNGPVAAPPAPPATAPCAPLPAPPEKKP
jgi:hypothetical protein